MTLSSSQVRQYSPAAHAPPNPPKEPHIIHASATMFAASEFKMLNDMLNSSTELEEVSVCIQRMIGVHSVGT